MDGKHVRSLQNIQMTFVVIDDDEKGSMLPFNK